MGAPLTEQSITLKHKRLGSQHSASRQPKNLIHKSLILGQVFVVGIGLVPAKKLLQNNFSICQQAVY